jgi:DNA-binding NarL/FixJ family response regulator
MRCLIVENQPITLFGLRRLLEQEFPGWNTSSANIVQAIDELRIVKQYPFDLVLVNVGQGDDRVLTYLAALERMSQGSCRSLVIQNTFDETYCALYRERGADGYISKEKSICELVDAISTVSSGANYFPGQQPGQSLEPPAEPKAIDSVRLTSRQKDLVKLVLRGYSNKKIANTLGLTSGTVKNYLFSIMRLYCVSSRGEMIAKLLTDQSALW